MLYFFVITTFGFLALWLGARSRVNHYRFLANEAINAAKEVIDAHETYEADVNRRFAGIREVTDGMKQRLSK